jgi:hypothetical protein
VIFGKKAAEPFSIGKNNIVFLFPEWNNAASFFPKLKPEAGVSVPEFSRLRA